MTNLTAWQIIVFGIVSSVALFGGGCLMRLVVTHAH